MAPVAIYFDRDEPLDCVDLNSLNARLKQVQEKLTGQWIARRLSQLAQSGA